MDEADMRRCLADLPGQDEKAARIALDRLHKCSVIPLKNRLVGLYGREYEGDIEDAITEAFSKIWKTRSRFVDQGPGAWHRYRDTTVQRSYLDIQRQKQKELHNIPIDSISDKDIGVVIDFLHAVYHKDVLEKLNHAADTIWLGLDKGLVSAAHDRQALAAKWFYLDGVEVDELISLLPVSKAETPLTPQTLDSWLTHPGVIRRLAYDELFFPNERLAWHLLGMEEPVDLDALSELTNQIGAETASQVTPEVTLILWRYLMALRPHEIARRKDCPCSPENLSVFLDSLASRFPFEKRTLKLLDGFRRSATLQTGEILSGSGLWRRLAFQYHYMETLVIYDVQERVHPAAETAGYEINVGMLNSWISGNRLVNKLATFLASTGQGDGDGR